MNRTDEELAAALYPTTAYPTQRRLPPDAFDRALARLYPSTPPPPTYVIEQPGGDRFREGR